MPVPKRRTSTSKRNKRRSHDAIGSPATDKCPECGETKLRHRSCPHCGVYRGRQIVEVTD